MQPSNPLILLGIAMIASSAIGVSAAAEPGMHHPPSAAEGEATSASSTSDAATKLETPSSAADGAASHSETSPRAAAELPGWQSSPSQKKESLKAPITAAQITTAQTTTAQTTTAQTTTGEERLDQLQRDSFIRQRRIESQNTPFDRPLAPAPNPLQVEQDLQRQLSVPNSTTGDPAQRLDHLQDQQRLRQQLRQQNRQPVPLPEPEPQSQASLSMDSQAEASSVVEDSPIETAQAEAAQVGLSELRPSKKSEKSQPASPLSESEGRESEGRLAQTAPAEPETTQETSTSADSESTGSESTTEPVLETPTAAPSQPLTKSEPTAANEAPLDNPTVDSSDSLDTSDTDDSGSSEAATESEEPAEIEATPDEAEATEAAQAPESLSQTFPALQDAPAPTQTPPALQDAPAPTEILEEAEEERRNTVDTDNRLFSDDSPAPEYLNPDPNPLSFPTSPDEVEIVGTQPITLKQAVELALRNNAELRQAQQTLERTQAELRETQSTNFPTLGANANFNQQGSESASRQPDTDFLGQPNPDAGDISVTYGDSTTLGAGLQLDYTIFTSGRRSALIEAARGQVRIQQLEIERQVEQLIFDTATNYYDLQEAGAQVNIFSANLEQAEQSLRDAQALERAGVGTRFDVLQAEVEVANSRQDLTQQLSQLEISRRQLAQQINISESLDISAADPIEVSGVWDLSLEESIIQAYKNRVELEQSLIQREVAQRNRRAALAQLGPQVGFSGAFNVVNDFDNDFTFLHNYQLGLTVTQSLYDGGLARSQANQQEANIAIAESEFENRREQIRFEVEQAYSQLDANFANIQTTALAVEQAAEALRLARLRFQAGVGTQTDVLIQQTELARSQVNNLSAILSYNRAIVSLERAVSNYPEGYLNEVP